MRRAALLLLVAALGCAGNKLKPGFVKDGEVVEAEGWSPVDPADRLATSRRALAEAQKKAVEKVVGVYISAKTRVSRSVHLEQNILADVGGYIRRYEVLREWEEEGFHKTRIRALVLYKKVGEDLKSLGLGGGPPPGNPRVAVRVEAPGEWSEAKHDKASGAVRRALLDRGFAVINPDDPAMARAGGEAGALAAARAAGADLLVRGKAEVHPVRDARLAGFISYRARIELEVVKTASGEVVSRRSGEASALDPSAALAEGKALENAGLVAAQGLAGELAEILQARTNVVLRVLGIGDLEAVRRLADDLRLQPEVDAVTLSEYRKEGAELAVTTDKLAGDDFAALLLRMRRYPFQVRAVSPYLVEVSVGL